MSAVSSGVQEYTGSGKTADLSIPVLGVTVWEFFREMVTMSVENVLNHIGSVLMLLFPALAGFIS